MFRGHFLSFLALVFYGLPQLRLLCIQDRFSARLMKPFEGVPLSEGAEKKQKRDAALVEARKKALKAMREVCFRHLSPIIRPSSQFTLKAA